MSPARPDGYDEAGTGRAGRHRTQLQAASLLEPYLIAKGPFPGNISVYMERKARFSPVVGGTGHTSAQLALLVDLVRSPIMRRITDCSPFQSPYVSESRLMPTIALVDDDRNILTSVSIALEAEGYRIMTYTDGASALDGFRTS